MVPSRVIRIDDEVWAELQRRAIPLVDNPNSTLRKILGLGDQETSTQDSEENDMDERIVKLINMVGELNGRLLDVRPLKKSPYFKMLTDAGKVFGYVYTQKTKLKVEIKKDWAEKGGLHEWEKELLNGWHNTGISSVYWYIPDGKENAYDRVANHLKKMRKLIV